MSIIQIYMPDSSTPLIFDLSPVINPRSVGLETAWEKGCEIYQKLIGLLTVIQNQHSRTKAALYQEYKQIPVNKDATKGAINPGTDTHFTSLWMPAQERYQFSRMQRDLVLGTMTALSMTYLPRLRMLFEKSDYGERNVPSQAGAMSGVIQPLVQSVPVAQATR